MKTKQYIVPAIFALALLAGCQFLVLPGSLDTGPASTTPDSDPGAGLTATFYLPNWDQPKTGVQPFHTLVVDPRTIMAELYFDSGAGESLLSTIGLSVSGGSGLSDPAALASGTFSGLDAQTYAAGELVLYLSDGSTVFTRGVNLDAVTLTAQGGQSVVFSSVPYAAVGATVSASAAIGEIVLDSETNYYSFPAIGGKTYRIDTTRTSAGGDLDVYLFDSNGFPINDDYGAEATDELLTLYVAPSSDMTVYIAAHAYATGGDVTYDIDVVDASVAGEYAISGILTMPPGAVAGDMAYLKISTGVTTIQTHAKAIGRTGDQFLRYVVPGIPGSSPSLTVWAVVDRNGNSTYPGQVSADTGDFSGSYGSSVVMGGAHKSGISFALVEQLGISGTFTFPATVGTSTPLVMYLATETGWPNASYSPFYLPSAGTSFNFAFSATNGTYRVGLIVDRDASGSGSISTGPQVSAYLTENDYFYLSEPITVSGASITGLSHTLETAAVLTGTVTLPESLTGRNYVVFADSDQTYANGVRYGDYFYLDPSTPSSSISYRLVVGAGSSYYIGALVDGPNGGRNLSSGDLFGYLGGTATDPPVSPTPIAAGQTGVDFTIAPFDVGLTGTVKLPAGVNADGLQFIVGFVQQDLWSTPAAVPGGTGTAGAFPYSLSGIPIGTGFDLAVVVDMDGNGFDLSPNYGDVVGFQSGFDVPNAGGAVFNFDSTTVFQAAVGGTLSLPVSASGRSYRVFLSGDVASEEGTASGLSIDYMLSDVPDGSYDVYALVDMDSDGVYGNTGDLYGWGGIVVAGSDVFGGSANLTLGVNANLISGHIQLPVDLGATTPFTVLITDESSPSTFFSHTGTIMTDGDGLSDGFEYGVFDVPSGTYIVSVHIDMDGDTTESTGDYLAVYPFGQAAGTEEAVSVGNDIIGLNFSVDPASQL